MSTSTKMLKSIKRVMKNERSTFRSACKTLLSTLHSHLEWLEIYDAHDSYSWETYDEITFLEAKLIATPEPQTPKNSLGAMFPNLANLKLR